ncbi:hypothetical protein SPFM12_00170 [Salmonella phage SPFM12]|nr:hypothetical protein SPFM12_00170 [Salmonella phage SPFM12]
MMEKPGYMVDLNAKLITAKEIAVRQGTLKMAVGSNCNGPQKTTFNDLDEALEVCREPLLLDQDVYERVFLECAKTLKVLVLLGALVAPMVAHAADNRCCGRRNPTLSISTYGETMNHDFSTYRTRWIWEDCLHPILIHTTRPTQSVSD